MQPKNVVGNVSDCRLVRFSRKTQAGAVFMAAGCACACSASDQDGGYKGSNTHSASQELQEGPSLAERRNMLKQYFAMRRSRLNIVATTLTADGQSLDWIDPSSQTPSGKVATPPPPPRNAPRAEVLDVLGEDEMGPPGTVPVLRKDTDDFLSRIDPPPTVADYLSKISKSGGRGPSSQGVEPPGPMHFHANAWMNQTNNVFGSDAFFTVLAPFVERNDEFSLTQFWIQATTSGSVLESVESGVQKYHLLYGDNNPHFFVYYTTNGYTNDADNQGGYNQDFDGWVQVSSDFYPGRSLSAGAGTYTQVLMSGGNRWWVWSGSAAQWIGYYPGSLFASSGLRSNGDFAGWGGEVVDATNDGDPTETDMGTGKYAWQSGAAKIDNIRLKKQSSWQAWNSASFGVEMSNCWNIEDHSLSGTSDGSYFYYGGPGKNSIFCP